MASCCLQSWGASEITSAGPLWTWGETHTQGKRWWAAMALLGRAGKSDSCQWKQDTCLSSECLPRAGSKRPRPPTCCCCSANHTGSQRRADDCWETGPYAPSLGPRFREDKHLFPGPFWPLPAHLCLSVLESLQTAPAGQTPFLLHLRSAKACLPVPGASRGCPTVS